MSEIEKAVRKALEARDAEWIAYTGMPAPSEEFCQSYWDTRPATIEKIEKPVSNTEILMLEALGNILLATSPGRNSQEIYAKIQFQLKNHGGELE